MESKDTGPKSPSGERQTLRLIQGGLVKENRTQRIIEDRIKNNEGKQLDKQNKGIRKDKNGVTARQEKFARLVGMESKSLSDAYRESYSVENMQRSTIWKSAWQVSQNPNVIKRIEHYTRQRNASALHDSGRVRAFILQQLQDIAEQGQRDSDKLKALELLGKVDFVGLFKERTENINVSVPDNPEEIAARLREIIEKAS